MRFLMLCLFTLFATVGCKQLLPAPAKGVVGVILTPIKAIGCDVESAVVGAFGAEVVSECAGTDPAGCGAAFLEVLGNVNLCAAPLPSAPAPAGLVPKVIGSGWKTVGDVPASALKAKKDGGSLKPRAVQAAGIVGAIACPIAINAGLGLLTAKIPAACGCKQNLSASALGSALASACVAVVPL